MQPLEAPEKHPLRSYFPVALVAILGIGLSFMLFFIADDWEQTNQHIEFESRSRDYANAVQNNLHECLGALNFLADFFDNSADISRQRFASYTHSILSRYPGIQALSWNPIISDDSRKTYELRAAQAGLQDFHFMQRNSAGKLTVATQRQEYIVVYYIEPMALNRSALGYDIASNPSRKRAIDQAFESGKLTATSRVTLVQESGNQFGVLIFFPLYQKNAPLDTVAQRLDNRKALLVEVFRIGDVVEAALADFPDEGIDLYLYDTSAPGQHFLYFRPSRQSGMATPVAEDAFEHELQWRQKFALAGRQWEIQLRPSAFYLDNQSRFKSWFIFIVSLILTLILTVYLLKRLSYTAEVEWRARIQQQTNLELENEVFERCQAESEIRQTNDKLNQANHMLKSTQGQLVQAAKLASIGEICAGLAHELNQPLGAILLNTQFIEKMQARMGIKVTKIDAKLESIIKQVARITRIIKHLKMFSRESSDKKTPANINELIHNAFILFNETLKIKGIRVKKDLMADLPPVNCDTIQIEQVLTNLLSNAIDAVEDANGKLLTVRSGRCGDMLKVEVEDSGCGISASNMAKVFDPFFTTKPVGKGTGLGMSISHGLIDNHHGKLTLTSTEGKGSCFTLCLPLTDATELSTITREG